LWLTVITWLYLYINYDRHLTVHMTWLGHLILYDWLYYFLFMILIIWLSFISVYHVVIVHTIYMHEHFSFLIHSLGRFWRPWIYTSRYWICFILVIRCSMSHACCDKFEVSPYLILVFLPPFYSCFYTFLDSFISDSVFILFLYLYDIIRGCLYVILQWSLIHNSIDI